MWKYPETIKIDKQEFILLREYPSFGLYENKQFGYKTCLSLANIMDISRKLMLQENNKKKKATNKRIKYKLCLR